MKNRTRASAGSKTAIKDFPFVLLVYFADKVFFAVVECSGLGNAVRERPQVYPEVMGHVFFL